MRRRSTLARRLGAALSVVGLLSVVTGCARMHHVQVAEIDSSRGALTPFEIQVDATGVNASEGATVAKAVVRTESARRAAGTAETLIALSQMGPQTGDPTFSDDWADGMLAKILERCPSGRVTGLVSRRETMDYPVVTGEIVTIKGYCIQ